MNEEEVIKSTLPNKLKSVIKQIQDATQLELLECTEEDLEKYWFFKYNQE